MKTQFHIIFLFLNFVLLVLSLQSHMLQAETTLKTETAVLAGGCFWCMQPPFDKAKGVLKTEVGYTGGQKKNPSYKEVASGKTRHREAIRVVFNPQVISYKKILDIFWRQINPTDFEGQFVDRGHQYSTAIYYTSQEQKKVALESKKDLDKSGYYKNKVVTPIEEASVFYLAEDYHQSYYRKNPIRYKFYRYNSGRDQYLERVWKEKKSQP